MTVDMSPSPDPLALNGIPENDEMGDCIIVSNTSPKLAAGRNSQASNSNSNSTSTSTSTFTPTKSRVQPVVEIVTPRKRKKMDNENGSTPAKRTPTTAIKGSKTPSRASPTPNGKVKATPLSSRIPHQISTTPSRKSTPTNHASNSRIKGTPTLASNLSKQLPTPSPILNGSSRKKPRISSPDIAKTLTFDDEIFETPLSGSGSGSMKDDVSRLTFLANEAMKRQREARNFIYNGEASAPKLTRSGRVVGQDVTGTESEELDEYGGKQDDISINPMGVQAPLIPDIEVRTEMDQDIRMDNETEQGQINTGITIPISVKSYLKHVLGTITSHNINRNPPPFAEESKNEPLTGLINLLKGTVERGEGNSALVVGPRGVGKTRTVARALNLLPSTSKTSPIVVQLSGLAQTNDRLAIREMGRQIAEAEGRKAETQEDDVEEDGNEEEYAPTTLPSHLLALLTQPSPRAIIIIIEEFDLFTEHARQALLYCLLDVVQSIKTGPVETTGRGVAVIGVTTRVDTLLLLEKRVKSRFSHRTFRIPSPLSSEGMGWLKLLKSVLIPPYETSMGAEGKIWYEDWQFAVEMLLGEERIKRNLDRLVGLTTDVRTLYRPFILPINEVLSSRCDFLSVPVIANSVLAQVDNAGWGLQLTKLRGLPHPAFGVLIIAKHLCYAGREEFNFAQVEEEYLRFSRTKLVGSGKVRWPIGILRSAFDQLLKLSLLVPASNISVKPQFTKVRCTLSPHEIVGWFKGEGANILGPELGNWGRMMGGHA
ncbi:uncharacterized protein IL334_007011 [Kwoniella shivajii]|uniref:Origin recognition complex subunit 4 n=1 Tax=Kwoniella shivajii TaxID=564305 RepID=A0ABZ1D8A6_9TREE|nr:hypothetical protein IL334_007011 [Kwoniella shivajii]